MKDPKELQSSIDGMYKWAHDWRMDFNSKKCKVVQLGFNNTRSVYVRPHAEFATSARMVAML